MTTPDRGFLLLDKPEGPTSFSAVNRAARALGFRKAGHAGTLDPMATGLMLVGLGKATRLLEYLVGCDKSYRAVVRFGVETTTLDREGEVTREEPVPALAREAVEAVLRGFVGRITQEPPRHSAVKVGGVPLHRRARRGEEFDVPLREVEITRLELLSWEAPLLTLEVDCSSGTYIRSLARDIGSGLGLPATLWELRRTRCGRFSVEHATGLGEVAEAGPGIIRDPGEMVAGLPAIVLDSERAGQLAHGRAVRVEGAPADSPEVAAFDEAGALVAVCSVTGGLLKPEKVLV